MGIVFIVNGDNYLLILLKINFIRVIFIKVENV